MLEAVCAIILIWLFWRLFAGLAVAAIGAVVILALVLAHGGTPTAALLSGAAAFGWFTWVALSEP